jgi:hypothetical protein
VANWTSAAILDLLYSVKYCRNNGYRKFILVCYLPPASAASSICNPVDGGECGKKLKRLSCVRSKVANFATLFSDFLLKFFVVAYWSYLSLSVSSLIYFSPFFDLISFSFYSF